MKTNAIKMKDGLFIQNIGAFKDINKEVIEVEIDISKEESKHLDYKELRGLSIMEKYYEKEMRSIEDIQIDDLNFIDKTINTIDKLILAIDKEEI